MQAPRNSSWSTDCDSRAVRTSTSPANRSWPREHKIAAFGVVTALLGVVVTLLVGIAQLRNHSGISTTVGTNNGVINNGTIIGSAPVTGAASPATSLCPDAASPPKSGGEQTRILVKVDRDDSSCYTDSLTLARLPATLSMVITYFNATATTTQRVVAGVNLAPYMHLVPQTTRLVTSSTSVQGVPIADHVDTGGVYIGAFAPSASGSLFFKVSVESADGLSCGIHQLSVTGIAGSSGPSDPHGLATVRFTRHC
jgi:hypothetical protein